MSGVWESVDLGKEFQLLPRMIDVLESIRDESAENRQDIVRAKTEALLEHITHVKQLIKSLPEMLQSIVFQS